MKNFVTIISRLLIFLCLLMISVSCTFLSRYIFLNAPDVYDYKKLPLRVIKNDPSTVFNFKTSQDFNLNSLVPIIFNTSKVTDLDTFLEKTGTTAFLIIRNDSILYERYFNGHKNDTYCKAFSVSKVFLSSLIGIAIDEGNIQSVNDAVMKYLPEIKDKRFAGLTINHCLSLTSGIKTNNKQIFPWNDKVRIYYTPDIRKLLSNIEYDHEPGKEYAVEEVSPVLLAMVLEKATGKSVSAYLEEKIWKPLGMSHDGLWVIDSKKHGFEAANSGLTGLPVDFAKLGRLYLNNGKFNNKQIISPEWVRRSTIADTTSVCFWRKIDYYEKKDVYFNRMWLGLRTNDMDYSYFASGHFGQRIFISPAKNAIIVRFGTKDGKVDWTSFLMKLVEKI